MFNTLWGSRSHQGPDGVKRDGGGRHFAEWAFRTCMCTDSTCAHNGHSRVHHLATTLSWMARIGQKAIGMKSMEWRGPGTCVPCFPNLILLCFFICNRNMRNPYPSCATKRNEYAFS